MDAKIYKNKKMIIFFLIPAFAMMFIFLYMPFVQNILNSFRKINGDFTIPKTLNDPVWKNYALIIKDETMLLALKNTIIMIFSTIFGQVGMALLLALLVSNIKKGAGIYRVVYFFPIVVSATALGLLFNTIFQKDGGLLNVVIEMFSPGRTATDWKDPQHAMLTMLTPVIWQYVGFYFVILLTGISGIPEELYEAASIDGASKLQSVYYITLPLLVSSISTCVILAVTGALKVFDLPYTMFPGGIANGSKIWLTGTYMYSKNQKDIDYAATIAIAIVVLGVVLSFVVNKIFESAEDYTE
ncbi:MAG: sugar ABC transporter permease [Lachnospiraceae bacterium]|nr:sugar ABC transporter permease [Lachnospiraceae bacterium]